MHNNVSVARGTRRNARHAAQRPARGAASSTLRWSLLACPHHPHHPHHHPPHSLIAQAESQHLDAGSFQRRLEADAALARKEAAQIEARYKAERAQWVAEVDMQKIEVARLSRELEGLEEQRARAREEAQRAERARIQLEAEVKVGGGERACSWWYHACCQLRCATRQPRSHARVCHPHRSCHLPRSCASLRSSGCARRR